MENPDPVVWGNITQNIVTIYLLLLSLSNNQALVLTAIERWDSQMKGKHGIIDINCGTTWLQCLNYNKEVDTEAAITIQLKTGESYNYC